MMAEHDAFASSYDADSEHEEGKFYVWSKAEIDAALSPDLAALVCRVYGVTDEGNWEDHNILHRNHPNAKIEETDEAKLDGARQTLLALRAKRVWPGRDDKVLADWNGMMIAALAKAAFAFDKPDWLAAARKAFDAIVLHMTRSETNREVRLHHSLRLGRLQPDAMLDDYAQMTRAALALYETTGETAFLHKAEAWMETAHRHYHDETGGYFFTADDAPTLIVRTKSCARPRPSLRQWRDGRMLGAAVPHHRQRRLSPTRRNNRHRLHRRNRPPVSLDGRVAQCLGAAR